MKCAAIALAVIFIGSFGTIHTAMAVGYERHDGPSAAQSDSETPGQAAQSIYNAVKNATFVEKYPVIIEEVAVFVKDILGQFGLEKNVP